MTNITVKCSRITENKTTISYTVEGEFGGERMKNNTKVSIDRDAMTITAPENYFNTVRKVRSPAPKATPYEGMVMALEQAANRACHIGREGATKAQINYLAKLAMDAGETADDMGLSITDTQAVLTKDAASNLIADYS